MQADCNATKWRIDKSFDQLIGRIPGSDALAVITSAPDSGDWTLNQVDLEQGTVSPLLTSVLPGVNPVWTADGRWLAAALIDRSDFGLFLTEVSTPGVYLINTQTHESTLIYEGIAGALAWTPDGDQLAFETFNPDTLVRSLRIYDRPTQTLRRIDTPGTLETAPHWSAFRGWHFAILPVIVGNLLLVGTLWLPQRLRYRRR